MLKKILEAKSKRLAFSKKTLPLKILKNRVSLKSTTRNFRQALLTSKISIIAEIKKASPSAGDIAPNLDIKKTAIIYENSGAAAISVLTEEDFFKGSPQYIKIVKQVSRIPILRKDFIFDEYQIYESRFLGADALLLIAAVLDEKSLCKLSDLTLKLNMEPLVEVHTEEDVKKVKRTKARVIGINNRNLKTFKTNLEVTKRLMPLVDKNSVVVSESGIKEKDNVDFLKKLGIDAILVGEAIIRAGNIKEKLLSFF